MQRIEIHSIEGSEILKQLNDYLKGEVEEQWGEYVLRFDNKFGKGIIRSISFDWGVSLLDYDLHFFEDTKVIFTIKDVNPIEFIFISEGRLEYDNDSNDEKSQCFERYQNIIISTKKLSKEAYVFPKLEDVKVNFIYILPREYAKKNNNNLSYLGKKLLSVFNQEESSLPYHHFGNYNLKIADQIEQLKKSNDIGIVRTLSIEGQLNLIMAMQLLEHFNHENEVGLPESLSKEDIKKIQNLSGYIIDNISDPLSVNLLANKAGVSTKKLQLGFNVLYSKSVNEYIRQLKLEVSRDYIKNTNDSISEIVYNIGLKSRSYFSKIFFERYGILPTEYRKKVKRDK
ncbi:AraC family transcriptional regulator [Aquimarina sp. AD1]|uniref:helix-turn-helix domain-containing protein n=1 Tax=Aquimarina sp. (strain AD1) TaxID=1714848 RepID=UPI000E503FF8|nr:AraC family transcriptional regulator [Aquimarina sp. AD1]AXT57175.1 AraC family transcriptional regulator [Aquimarina sp. AD1]RKN35837.1 helix-turn-helix domain-containing protein [Aquimarina sp. AD1]